jgi:hypothetical protein
MTKTEAHSLLNMVKDGTYFKYRKIRKALVLTGDVCGLPGRPRKQNGGTLRTNGDQPHRTFSAHGEVFSEGLSGPWKKSIGAIE